MQKDRIAKLIERLRGANVGTRGIAMCQEAADELERITAAPASEARWYCVSKYGRATPCADEADALAEVERDTEDWPLHAPYRAVQLVDAEEVYRLKEAIGRALAGYPDDDCAPTCVAILREALKIGRRQMRSAPEPWTAKEKALVAADGQPCPNNHDPDCRWPQCRCREPPNE